MPAIAALLPGTAPPVLPVAPLSAGASAGEGTPNFTALIATLGKPAPAPGRSLPDGAGPDDAATLAMLPANGQADEMTPLRSRGEKAVLPLARRTRHDGEAADTPERSFVPTESDDAAARSEHRCDETPSTRDAIAAPPSALLVAPPSPHLVAPPSAMPTPALAAQVAVAEPARIVDARSGISHVDAALAFSGRPSAPVAGVLMTMSPPTPDRSGAVRPATVPAILPQAVAAPSSAPSASTRRSASTASAATAPSPPHPSPAPLSPKLRRQTNVAELAVVAPPPARAASQAVAEAAPAGSGLAPTVVRRPGGPDPVDRPDPARPLAFGTEDAVQRPILPLAPGRRADADAPVPATTAHVPPAPPASVVLLPVTSLEAASAAPSAGQPVPTPGADQPASPEHVGFTPADLPSAVPFRSAPFAPPEPAPFAAEGFPPAPPRSAPLQPGATSPGAAAPQLPGPALPPASPVALRADVEARPTLPAAAPPPFPVQSAAPNLAAASPPLDTAALLNRRAGARTAQPAEDPAPSLAATALTPAAQSPAAAPSLPIDMARHIWPAAMIDRIEQLRDAADAVSTSIRVRPDALGTVEVSVRRDGDVTHVHLAAEQPQTRVLLAEAQPKLAELAEQRGLRLGQTSVDAGSGGGQPTSHQQHGQPGPRRAPPSAAARPAAIPTNDDRIA